MRRSPNHGGVVVDRKAARNQIKGKRLEVECLSCPFGYFPHSAFNYVISDASEERPQKLQAQLARCFSSKADEPQPTGPL